MKNLKEQIIKRIEEHISIAVTRIAPNFQGEDQINLIERTKECVRILILSDMNNEDVEEYNRLIEIINEKCNTKLGRIIKTITLEQ